MSYTVKKGKIREIEILFKRDLNHSLVKDKQGKVFEVYKTDICDTTEEALLLKKEIELRTVFKNLKRGKKGKHTCEWCGKKGENLTLDHIIPLSYFGGKKQIRKNINTWEKAWSTDNFQILCEDCNQNKKDTLLNENTSLEKIDLHARVLNNKKILSKNACRNSPINKVGYGLSTGKWAKRKRDIEVVEYIAKADSRILRMDMIFNKKESYDNLPKII